MSVKKLEQILKKIEEIDSLLKEASVVEKPIFSSLYAFRAAVKEELKEHVYKQYLEAEG